MTVHQTDATTDPQSIVAALQQRLDEALAREAALAEALATRNSEYGERIEQQSATIDVLKVMSVSPGDPLPVFELIANRARAFCEADGAMVTLLEDGMLHLRTHIGATQAASAAYEAYFPCPVDDSTTLGRAVLTCAPVHNPDLLADPGYRMKAITSVNLVRSNAAVPILRAGVPIGAIGINWLSVGEFPTAQLELLKTFAEQAVIAITSAETYRALQTRSADLQESLEYQTATSDVLKVISRSTFDLQPVLDTVAETAARLCDADQAAIYRREGNSARLVANFGFPPEYETHTRALGAFPIDPNAAAVGQRTLVEGRPVHVHDVAAVPGYWEIAISLGKQRTSLGVPLLREGETIGNIMLARQRVEPFTERQIELVSTFADQAVIAIENTRLITEQREALEQQTATAEVLQVINASPGNLAPVFDAILDKAHTFCSADHGALALYDGETFRAVAVNSASDAFAERLREGVRAAGNPVAQPLLDGARFVHVSDQAEIDHPQTRAAVEHTGARTVLAVPLRKDDLLLGAITAVRQEVRPFTDKQIALLQNFAAQAVIAMENARLLTEQREALEQQTATAEVLQVINASPGNLAPVFAAVLEKAMRLCEAAFGLLLTYDGERFHLAAHHGVPKAFLGFREQHATAEPYSAGAARVLETKRPLQTLDVREGEGYRAGNPISRGFVELAGTRTALAVPLLKDQAVVGAFLIYRQEVRAFSNKQIGLLESFAAQAVIAMDNARLITEQREALEQQTATAEVLQVINTSPGDLAPVFDAMLEKAMRLCGAAYGVLRSFDGERPRMLASRGVPSEYAEFLSRYSGSLPAGAAPALGTSVKQALQTGLPAQRLDARESAGYKSGAPGGRAIVDLGGARTVLHVPLVKDQVSIGLLTFYRQEVRSFSDKQIALLQNFAAQAVIAMENARLLTEQREALEQQTATAEVLGIINANPGNLAPAFGAILEKAHALCGAAFGSLYTFDGERFHSAAHRNVPAAYAEYRENNPPRVVPGTGPFQLLQTKRPIQDLDIMSTEAYRAGYPNARAMVELGGIRTTVIVPLLGDDAVVGMITMFRQEVQAFSDRQVALLENFAAQAVIAMENARLLAEQAEALEQQTATAEVLQVINASPGDLTPVFDAILEKAMRLCGAAFGSLYTYDGEGFRSAAHRGVPSAYVDWREKVPPSPRTAVPARILAERCSIHVIDVMQEEDYKAGDIVLHKMVELGGIRTALSVPLLKDDAVLGFMTIFRQEVHAFSNKQIALLEGFAAQAVIAMENARLLNEVRQRQEELRITFENMGDGVAMFDESQRLVAWNGKFQEIFDLPDALLEQHRTYQEHLRFLAARGDFGVGVETVERIDELVATTGQPYGYERTRPDGRVIEIRRNPVPDGGFVLIFSDITERKRSEAEIRAARDAAEAAYRDLKAVQANLIQAEKMASLGQLTAGIAHEIKNPLNFVNNFAALSVDLLAELKETASPGFAVLSEEQRAEIDDLSTTLTGNLEKITEHGRRADGIVKAMLEHSRGSSSERRMVDLNALIEEALNLAYHGARAQDQSFNVALERDFGAGIAPIELNPQDITRAFLNLFGNALYATTRRARDGGDVGFEPTLKVTTRTAGDAVEIHVRDNGTGIPAEIRDKLFQPFFTTKPTGEGTGLGLSITYDIVTQQHGGIIAVDSKLGEYSEFTIRLPRGP